jgi:hypothetical protein
VFPSSAGVVTHLLCLLLLSYHRDMNHITRDMTHVIRDMTHITRDMTHVIRDTTHIMRDMPLVSWAGVVTHTHCHQSWIEIEKGVPAKSKSKCFLVYLVFCGGE